MNRYWLKFSDNSPTEWIGSTSPADAVFEFYLVNGSARVVVGIASCSCGWFPVRGLDVDLAGKL